MSPIPGERLDPKDPGLRTKDGRKVTLKIPGMEPPAKPEATEQRQPPEPPRDDPRGNVNPHTYGA
jgi:hypothetical protein